MATFEIFSQHDKARRGHIITDHGIVETPAFLFCATQGTLKGIATDILSAHDTQILLANTYHLMLQPGSALIEQLGGLHKFMSWVKPIFTDSGGYQIFSFSHGSVSCEIKGQRRFKTLPKKVIITEDGALFTSYRDGKHHFMTPETSIKVQCELGADFICVLDECTPLHMSREQTKQSLDLSHRWAVRSMNAFNMYKKNHQNLYGIIQGGVYPDFRKESVEFIGSMPFFGHAIGGSLGATKEQMSDVVNMALVDLPKHKPIHLLGIGAIKDIFSGVIKGIDTFDCVIPTRLGRHGCAIIKANYWSKAKEDFHNRDYINIWKACFRDDPKPIDDTCLCSTCRNYSRAYLHHLLKAKELLALSALTLHNVYSMNCLMRDIRDGITSKTLSLVYEKWVARDTSVLRMTS